MVVGRDGNSMVGYGGVGMEGDRGTHHQTLEENLDPVHHDVMKFLEESGLYFLCHVTSDAFGQMLADTHPAGHDPCVDAGITTKVPF